MDAWDPAAVEKHLANLESQLASRRIHGAQAIAEGEGEWGTVADVRSVAGDVVLLRDIEVDTSAVRDCLGREIEAVVPDGPKEHVHGGGGA